MGTLRIQTAKRTIVVTRDSCGFAFGEDSRGLAQRVFYSWTLARVLDDMIAKATDGKQRLSQRLFATLSGEAVVERNKHIYWAAAESTKRLWLVTRAALQRDAASNSATRSGLRRCTTPQPRGSGCAATPGYVAKPRWGTLGGYAKSSV